MGIILTIIIGGIAGWLAGKIMRGGGFGIPMNIVIGIVGSFIGGSMFWLLGLRATGLVGSLIAATLGSIVLLYISDYVNKRRA